MTSDHKPQSDQAVGPGDTNKVCLGVEQTNRFLQGIGETNSDTLQPDDQAAGSGDTSKARQGVEQTNQQMQGIGETNSDTLQPDDQAAGSGDTNQARMGVELTNQRLQNDGNDTALNETGAVPTDSQQSTTDLGVSKADLKAESSESRNEIIQVDDGTEIRFDELKPNAVYEKKGYRFYTDEQGRPARIGGFLQDEPGSRSPQQTEVGHLGYKDDEGGHLIATRFNGPTDGFNLVPQHMNLNRGAWNLPFA